MSIVYFTDMSSNSNLNLLQKLDILLEKIELNSLVKKNEFVAIKLHFGEYGNLSFVRPQYLKIIVDKLKLTGARVFLTDANTLYVGHRSNAVDHLLNAYLNGFTMDVVGAPIIIADGLKGGDYVPVKVDGNYIKQAKIASAIALADVLIFVTHFKGHEQTGFGGALKNVGMGCASRQGKLEQHSDSKPEVEEDHCVACRTCEKFCPTGAMSVSKVAKINYELCIGCGQCIAMCNYGAVNPGWDNSTELLSKKMVEYAKAVLKDKRAVFINFIMDVSPDCDCWHMNRPAVAPNVGITMSTDPVAIDQASLDLILKSTHEDPFLRAHPNVHWETQLSYAEQIGLGSRSYELIKIACDLH